MNLLLRVIAWGLAAAVTFATLGPARYRPRVDIGQGGEHALAFVLLGIAFGLVFRHSRLATALVALVMTGVIEIMQLWAPGRHARLSDFVVDALAVCAGIAGATLLDRFRINDPVRAS